MKRFQDGFKMDGAVEQAWHDLGIDEVFWGSLGK